MGKQGAVRSRGEVAEAGGTNYVRPLRNLSTGKDPMKQHFALDRGHMVESAATDARIMVFINPDAGERHTCAADHGIDAHDLASALDPEEIARVELGSEPGTATVIWKRPDPLADSDSRRFEVASVGLFLQREEVIIVVSDQRPPLSPSRPELDSAPEVILRVMLATIGEFVARLSEIKESANTIQERLAQSTDNRELVQMFNLSEDLVYYIDAIDANKTVLDRLRSYRTKLGLNDVDVALLDDLIIDTEQLARQGRNYSVILSGLIDARGNIVNNNVNALLKNLTIVNVVFLPMGLVASMGGMSEFSTLLRQRGVTLGWGYTAFAGALAVMGLLIFYLVSNWISSPSRRRPQDRSSRLRGRSGS